MKNGYSCGNSSWAWTFTKTFVSNFFSPKFYKQELSEGGCLNTFLEGVDQADVLGPVLNGSPGFAETAIKGQAGGWPPLNAREGFDSLSFPGVRVPHPLRV